MGTDLAADTDPDDAIAEIVREYGLAEEAAAQARAALPPLIAALAA